jgi:hypothetical protein
MKHFCIGMFKTGTSSYSKAMTMLGLTDLHFPPKYVAQLNAVGVAPWDARPWDSMSNVHEVEYQELEALYPGSKFILTTRKVDGWLKSVQRHMRGPWEPSLQAAFDVRFQKIFGIPCTGAAFDPWKLRRAFRDHDAAVREHFGSRLLVLDLDGGGDMLRQLSAFVGRAPAYPHVNKRTADNRPGEPVTIQLRRAG